MFHVFFNVISLSPCKAACVLLFLLIKYENPLKKCEKFLNIKIVEGVLYRGLWYVLECNIYKLLCNGTF